MQVGKVERGPGNARGGREATEERMAARRTNVQTHNLNKAWPTQPPGLWASHGPTHHFKLRHRAAQGPLLAVHK